MSIGKIAEKTIRDVRKIIDAELAPLRARVEALERAALASARLNSPIAPDCKIVRDAIAQSRTPGSERTA